MPNLTGKAANQVVTHGDLGPLAYYSQEMLGTAIAAGQKLMAVREEQTSGTNGGTPGSTGTWLTRVLNTVLANNIDGASLSSNLITLPAGSYWFDISAPCYRGNTHRIRLYNTTSSTVVAYGTAEFASTDSNAPQQTRSLLSVPVTLSAPSVFRLEHRVANVISAQFGVAASDGGVEVFSVVSVRKVS